MSILHLMQIVTLAFHLLPQALQILPTRRMPQQIRQGTAISVLPSANERSSTTNTTRELLTSVSDAYGAIKNVSCIVKYLLRSGGYAPSTEFTDNFKISQDFDAIMNWLLAKTNQDVSFTGHKANWIRSVYYKGRFILCRRPHAAGRTELSIFQLSLHFH